jgi:hypothetical protein
MATLLAITYPDPDRAKQAMASVDWSHLDHQIRVKDACWIRNENGELAVHPWHPVAGKAALGGGGARPGGGGGARSWSARSSRSRSLDSPRVP